MQIILAISWIVLMLSIFCLIGFGITLIVGASTKSKGAKKTGQIGLIIAGSLFVLSLVGTVGTAVSVFNQSESSSTQDNDTTDEDYDDTDEDADSNDDADSDDDFDSNNIGDEVEFDSGEKIKVNSIKDTSEKLPGMKSGQFGIVANITMTNPTKEDIEFNVQDFDAYDDNNDEGYLNTKDFDNNTAVKVAPGKSYTTNVYFTVKQKGIYSITYGDNSWDQ